MKYFSLQHSHYANEVSIPAMCGDTVKGHQEFFRTGCNIHSFYESNHSFDYLTPMHYGEFKDDPEIIADYHMWIRKKPRKGYFKPVSEKYRNLLSRFSFPDHRFYPATVLFNGERFSYYVLHLLYYSYLEFLDFDKTIFNNLNSFRKLSMKALEKKQFSSFEEMKNYSKANWNYDWNYERLVMKSEFRGIDYCYFYLIDGDVVSERLKDAIEATSITGVMFKELPIPIEFSN